MEDNFHMINKQTSTNMESNTTVKGVNKKEDLNDWFVDITNTYNFKDSEIGDSWHIGSGIGNIWANAYVNGEKDCPENITVPRTLTNKQNVTKPVEVIGETAFYACSNPEIGGGNTQRFTLTKQVKVIKHLGIYGLNNAIEFTIESGSVLERIDNLGLGFISYNIGGNETARTNLTLPSTLSYVAAEGIVCIHLFNVVAYCGSHPLTNYCDFEDPWAKYTIVRVTDQYPANNLFERTPVKEPEYIIEELCGIWERNEYFTFDYVDGGIEVTGWGNKSKHWTPPHLNIPPTIQKTPVVSIGERAFSELNFSDPIIIPSSVRRIGAHAFANAHNVSTIIFESNDLEIGEGAFEGLGKDLDQPINLTLHRNTRAGKNAFAGAKIGEVYVL